MDRDDIVLVRPGMTLPLDLPEQESGESEEVGASEAAVASDDELLESDTRRDSATSLHLAVSRSPEPVALGDLGTGRVADQHDGRHSAFESLEHSANPIAGPSAALLTSPPDAELTAVSRSREKRDRARLFLASME